MKHATFAKEEGGRKRGNSPSFKDDAVVLCTFFPRDFIDLHAFNVRV